MTGKALRLMTPVTFALLLGGCGSSDDGATTSPTAEATSEAPSGPATSVKVDLRSFSITTEPTQAPAGTVTFGLTATQGFHNFIVIQTDLPPDDLPLRSPAGPVETDTAETKVVGLVPIPFEGGKSLTVDVRPGNYVLICNTEAHYVRGMRTGFTVA